MNGAVMTACIYPDMSYQFASRAYRNEIGWQGEIAGVAVEQIHGSEALFQLQEALARSRHDGTACLLWQPDQHQTSLWLQLEVCWNPAAGIFILNALTAEKASLYQAVKRPDAGLFDFTPQAVMVMDTENRIIQVNRGFSRVTGYRFDEVVGEGPGIITTGDIDPERFDHLWEQLHKRGVWEGELWNRHKNGQQYPAWFTLTARRDALGEVDGYVAQFSSLSSLESDRQAAYYHSYDPLTGLADSAMFHQCCEVQLRQAQQQATALAVLLIELEDVQDESASLGSLATDTLLREMAGRFSRELREGDLVAYLEGSQFAVSITTLGDHPRVEQVARRLLDRIAETVQLNDQLITVRGSIGIAVSTPEERRSEQLLDNARIALQAAQQAGGAMCRRYSEQMSAAASQVIRSHALRTAVDEDSWELRFNPVYSLHDHALIGAEIVPSWQHPEQGLLPSDAFVALLSAAGALAEYQQQIGERLRGFIQHWADFENLGSIHLRLQDEELFTAGFIPALLRTMFRYDIAPQRLLVAVSALQVLHFPDEIEQLKAQGVRLLIGGLEHCPLTLPQLQGLAPDMLLLDADLVEGQMQDERRTTVVETLLTMAQRLQIEVLAEGVRTTGQMTRLSQQGCYRMSGKYVGRNLTMAQLLERLEVEM